MILNGEAQKNFKWSDAIAKITELGFVFSNTDGRGKPIYTKGTDKILVCHSCNWIRHNDKKVMIREVMAYLKSLENA